MPSSAPNSTLRGSCQGGWRGGCGLISALPCLLPPATSVFLHAVFYHCQWGPSRSRDGDPIFVPGLQPCMTSSPRQPRQNTTRNLHRQSRQIPSPRVSMSARLDAPAATEATEDAAKCALPQHGTAKAFVPRRTCDPGHNFALIGARNMQVKMIPGIRRRRTSQGISSERVTRLQC